MTLYTLHDMPKSGALLGIDPGKKTLGLAICDVTQLIASPHSVIKRTTLKADLASVFKLYSERNCTGMIIGLPLNMQGDEGPSAQSARALARNILKFCDIPIAFQDERLTSAQAERAMLEGDLSRRRRADLIDAAAASVILQTAIDRLANS